MPASLSQMVSGNKPNPAECAYKVHGTVTIDTSVSNSTLIDYRRYNGGNFTVPSGSSITTLTFYTAHEDVSASYIAAYTEANAAVTMTVAASRRYPLPAALAGAHFIRATGNAAGTLTNVVLKSI